MSDYILSCCSTADISAEHFEKRDIRYICFHFALGDQEYVDDLGKSVPFADFYRRMEEGEMTRTSQINVEEYVEYFKGFLEAGKDIVHVTLSSGISGTINSARAAVTLLQDKYPARKIYIVDSLGASSGYGLFMDKLADLKDGGMSAPDLVCWAEDHKLNLHHWFFSTDLKYYVRGGRISKASGFFGTLLKICPLLNMDDLGRLIPRNKIRTKRKVIEEIVARMEECADGGLDYDGKCYISESACMEDAKTVAALVESRFKKTERQGGDQQHRYDDRRAYGTGYGRSLLLGQKAHALTFRHFMLFRRTNFFRNLISTGGLLSVVSFRRTSFLFVMSFRRVRKNLATIGTISDSLGDKGGDKFPRRTN